MTVHVKSLPGGRFDVTTRTPSGAERTFAHVRAHLAGAGSSTLTATLDGARTRTTVVVQRAPGAGAGTGSRVHVFEGARRTTLGVPAPAWLQALGGDAAGAGRGALRAPMPSVVVEVRVAVGERVEAGQPVVVLESMKTETVLRAPVAGVVKAVGCAKGEMVEEGRELVDVEDDNGKPA